MTLKPGFDDARDQYVDVLREGPQSAVAYPSYGAWDNVKTYRCKGRKKGKGCTLAAPPKGSPNKKKMFVET